MRIIGVSGELMSGKFSSFGNTQLFSIHICSKTNGGMTTAENSNVFDIRVLSHLILIRIQLGNARIWYVIAV